MLSGIHGLRPALGEEMMVMASVDKIEERRALPSISAYVLH